MNVKCKSLALWECLHITTKTELLESRDNKQGTKSPQAWGSEKQHWKLYTSVVSIPFTELEYYERMN